MSTDYDKIRANLAQQGYEGAELDREAETTAAKVAGVRIGADVTRDRIATLEAQRDDLARCLRALVDGFTHSDFVYDASNAEAIFKMATLLTRCQAALARSGADAAPKEAA